MSRFFPAGAALLILIAAIALRCWHIGSWPLWLDESWSRWMTEQSWSGLWHAASRYDTHPPFYYSLLKAWTGIAPSTPFWLRFPSLIASLLMLPIAWACTSEIAALRRIPMARWTAVALVAVSPPLIAAASQARPYALLALAFGLALWAGLRLLHAEAGSRAGWRYWFLYLAGFVATLWLHSLGALFAAALAVGLGLGFAAAGTLRANLVKWLGVHAGAGLLWLPAFLVLLEQRRNWSASSWLAFSWTEVPAGLATGLSISGPIGIVLLLAIYPGVRALLKDRSDRPAALLLLSAALLPALLIIFVSALLSPVFLPRTLIPSVLPVLLVLATAISSLSSRGAMLLAAGALILVLGQSSASHAISQPEEKWPALGAWLAPRIGPNEELWLLPNELALPFRYGAGPTRFAVRGIPAGFPAPHHPGPRPSGSRAVLAMSRADADRLVDDARRRGLTGIWVVTRFPRLFDPERTIPAAFNEDRRDMRDVRFAPLIVEHYRL